MTVTVPATVTEAATWLASAPAAGNPNAVLSLVLLAAGLLLFVFVMTNMIRKRAQRPTTPASDTSLPPADRLESIRRAAEQHDRLTTLMVDVEQLTRRCAAQLDNKADRLELLIERAEERIAQFEGMGVKDVGAEQQSAPTTDPTPAPAAQTQPPDPLAAEVYRLADAGKSAVEIAGDLQQSTGTVELILNLRRA